MQKIIKIFNLPISVSSKPVKKLKLVTDHIGVLIVEFAVVLNSASKGFYIDLQAVYWNDSNILSVLQAADGFEEIEEAANQFFLEIITKQS